MNKHEVVKATIQSSAEKVYYIHRNVLASQTESLCGENTFQKATTGHDEPRGGTGRQECSVDSESGISSTTLRKQNRYLFDIVASLCAGFNEHDIQFLSSLLALLRGDLSAPVKAEGWRWPNRQIWKETAKTTGKKKREEMERRTQRAQQ